MFKFSRTGRFVIYPLAAALAVFLLVVKAPESYNRHIIASVAPKIVELVRPSNHGNGGTGFVVKTQAGTLITLTNAHVCRIAEGGKLDAMIPGTERYMTVSVLEISTVADLCAVQAIPGITEGLTLANSLDIYQTVSVIGHPKLQTTTMRTGQVTSIEDISVAIEMQGTLDSCNAAKGELHSFLGVFTVCVKEYRAVRTTAEVYGGNSGSPAVNVYGNVIGVLFAGDNDTNWGFLVPLQEVKEFLSVY